MDTALEHILTSFYKADLISYMDKHPGDFEELIRLAVSNKKIYSWRAAWLLWSCMKENDRRIQDHLQAIVRNLGSRSDNQLRELLKILQQMDVSEKYESRVFDVCVTVWESIDKQPSVRFNAFKMIVKMAQKHPELSHEILLLTQNRYLDSLSPAVKKSISKMIKRIN